MCFASFNGGVIDLFSYLLSDLEEEPQLRLFTGVKHGRLIHVHTDEPSPPSFLSFSVKEFVGSCFCFVFFSNGISNLIYLIIKKFKWSRIPTAELLQDL